MEYQNDLQDWLNRFSCPAFSVKENTIIACNQAAEGLLITLGDPAPFCCLPWARRWLPSVPLEGQYQSISCSRLFKNLSPCFLLPEGQLPVG